MSDNQKKRDDALERIGAALEQAEAAGMVTVTTLSTSDLNLMFDEIDRLREREDASYQHGLEMNLLT